MNKRPMSCHCCLGTQGLSHGATKGDVLWCQCWAGRALCHSNCCIQCIPLAAEAKWDLLLLRPGWVFPGVSLQPRPGCEWLSLQFCVLDVPQGTWTSLLHTTSPVSFPCFKLFSHSFHFRVRADTARIVRQFIHILYFTVASTRKEMP